MKSELTTLYSRLFSSWKEAAKTAILERSKTQSIVNIGFAYFAQLEMSDWYKEGNASEKFSDISQVILSADFLFADGIALRLLQYKWQHPEVSPISLLFGYKYYSKKAVPNLNGTDFLGFFLKNIPNKEQFHLVLYGTFPEYIQKAWFYAKESFGIETVFQDGYTEFNPLLLSEDKKNIVLVWLGSPRQEIWVESHETILQKWKGSIVFSVGGLFDFWGGREKRAPGVIRFFALEWLWRAVTNPKKNLKKTLVSLKFFWYLFSK